MTYKQLPVEQDPSKLATQLIAAVAKATGTTLNEGHPVTAMLEAMALATADMNVRAASRADTFFNDFGQHIVGLTRKREQFASLQVNVTSLEPANLEAIPTGTVFDADGHRFELIEGGRVNTTWELLAVVPGHQENGLEPTRLVALNQPWTVACTSVTPSSGGTHAESETEYLDRLAGSLTRMVSTAVTPDDFSRIALGVPGVAKAVALNRKNPDDLTADAHGHITVVLAGADGRGVSEEIKTEVRQRVEGIRAVSLVVHLEDPTIIDVPVAIWVRLTPGADQDTVRSALTAAVKAYCAPGVWDKWGGRTLYQFNIARSLNQVEGVSEIRDMKLNDKWAAFQVGNADALAPTLNPTVTVHFQ